MQKTFDGCDGADRLRSSLVDLLGESGIGIRFVEMAKVLRLHTGGSIHISAVKDEAESMEFAQSLRSTFLEAGWNVGPVEEVVYETPPLGLSVSTTFPAPEVRP